MEKELLSDAALERRARACPMLAYCPDRTFSFCLRKWVDVDGELMFRKVTFTQCCGCIENEKRIREKGASALSGPARG